MSISSNIRLLIAYAVLACVPLALTACESVDDDTVAENPPPAAVQDPPPQEMEVEIVPSIQSPQTEIWRPGYWALIDHRFVWVPGKIIPRPSPTAVWHTAHWVHHDYGWSFEMGHWE